MNPYVGNIVFMILIYSALATTLGMLLARAGLFSMAHAVFFGIGAFATANLETKHGLNWLLTVLVGAVIAAAIAAILSAISLRVSEDYFVIGSLGLQIIATAIILNWSVTGGSLGIAGVPAPRIAGWSPRTPTDFVWLAVGTLAVTVVIVAILNASPYGRALRAIKDDPIAAAACGKNVTGAKVWAFVVTGALASVAGSVYAVYLSYVSYQDFGVDLSILLVAVIVVGGAGRTLGAFVGSALLVLLPEALRHINVPPRMIGSMQQLIYGLLLVLFALARPAGIVGDLTLAGLGERLWWKQQKPGLLRGGHDE